MERDSARLFEEALKLPPEVRAALAAWLLESLEDAVDADAEAAWAVEIAKRIQELDSGDTHLVPWPEARRIILGR